MRLGGIAGSVAAALALAACDGHATQTEQPVSLSSGTYRATSGVGYAPADEARVLAVTAQLDRSAGRIVFTRFDGSQSELVFSPRPREQWQRDCYTMTSHTLDEVADLTPPPLQLESLTFATPVVFAKCGPGRMILADAPDETAAALLVLDLQ
jgi:hypothetical protein